MGREARLYLSRSPEETQELGHAIGQGLSGGEVLALYGELGTGKTVLVRGIAAGVGAPPAGVTSPTFVLIHEYHGRVRLAHADLYRIEHPDEMAHIGLWDYLDDRTAVVVEWAERGLRDLPPDRLEIRLSHLGQSARELSITALGPRATGLLQRIRPRLRDQPR